MGCDAVEYGGVTNVSEKSAASKLGNKGLSKLEVCYRCGKGKTRTDSILKGHIPIDKTESL
jgi:hypothetical protein